MTYDPRYTITTCPICGGKYQRIDWNCAAHQLTCSYPCPEPEEGYPEDKSVEGWRSFDKNHGLTNLTEPKF